MRSFQITLIHVDKWAGYEPGMDVQGLAGAIDYMAAQQAEGAKRGLPTILIHGSMGVHRTIAVAVCYLGRQIWMATGRIHPMQILQVSMD